MAMCNENCGKEDCEICNPNWGRLSDADAAKGNSKDREGK
jgi:hypothetical protein